MCGIAGMVSPKRDLATREAAVNRMVQRQQHRGPDDRGLHSDGPATLGMSRLAIIDPANGHQPMRSPDGRFTLVFNGAIYNYRELQTELALGGWHFRTNCDTEVLLAAYALHGAACLPRLRGMFAFAIWDAREQTLFAARDPLGIKPLYVLEHEGAVAFASEPRAFLAAGLIAPELSDDRARELLAFNYTLTDETIFKGLRRLEPGEIVEVAGGKLVPHGVRPAVPARTARGGDEADLLSQLDKVLENSVTVHQRSDVPYGLFLSGGVDSATIATLMSRLNERPVTAFTCGFDAPGARDERAQAERLGILVKFEIHDQPFDGGESPPCLRVRPLPARRRPSTSSRPSRCPAPRSRKS